MDTAEDFEQWMKEEDERMKFYVPKPEPPKENKLFIPRKYEKKEKQLSLF